MYIVILFSILAIWFTYRESRGQQKNGMAWGFALVTLLGAIHYDYGNDYMSYYGVYDSISKNNISISDILKGDLNIYGERGWHLLNYAFQYLGGFFVLVAVLNILQNWIIYKSIKKYVEPQWWPLSVFIFLCVTSFYLMEFTMMRQFVVMCVFLAMWPYIINRKWYVALMVLYLCSFVHSSSIILMPFAFWGYLPVRKYRVIGFMYACVFGILFLMGNVVGDAINLVVSMNDTMEEYTNIYKEREEELTFGIGFVMNIIPIFISMYYLFKHDINDSDEKVSLVILSSIGYLVTPFGWIIPLAGRMGMYFGMYKIVTIPYIYANIKNAKIRFLLLAFFILITSYDYFIFFKNPVWVDHYTEFRTIFEVL